MLTSFVLTMALAAPVPPAATPVPSGPAPRLMELKANADGQVQVTVTRTETVKVQIAAGNANPNGGAAPAVITREIPVSKTVNVDLADVKDLKITTVDGKKVEVADAVKHLKTGAVVVVSADGKPVTPNFLKAFRDDVLVLVSPELTAATNAASTVPAVRPVRPGNLVPLPAPVQPVPGVLPAQPGGVIQIQIQPGQIQVVPALPPVPAPAPEK